jgi:hypothetical protein
MVEFLVFYLLGYELILYDSTESTTLTMPLDFHKRYKQFLLFVAFNFPEQLRFVWEFINGFRSGVVLFQTSSRVLSFQCVFSSQCLNVQHRISYVCGEIKYSVYELIYQCLTAPMAIQILIECFCNCMEFSPFHNTWSGWGSSIQ